MSRPVPQVRADCREVLDGRSEALSALRDETILITGGTGFVGTWLAEALTCLNDDFGFGCRIVLLARGVERFAAARPHLAGRVDVKLLRADVRHLTELPRETNRIIHAAGTPDNRAHASTPVETIATIVEGAVNVVRALDPVSDFRRLLHLSSCYVYGAQPWSLSTVPETFDGGAPALGSASSAYGEAKRCAEALCAAARSERRIPVVVARPFAFLGPYQPLDTPWAANNFLLDALSGRPIRIQDDGETVRSYMYASDMANWLLRLLSADEAVNRAWNVGSPEAVTLRALAETIAGRVNPVPEVRLHAATRAGVPRTRFVPDVTAAQELLGLDLRVPLASAVEKTLRWNREAAATAGAAR
jgi:nucleoside-diphosphate-sugar epimerase